MRHCQKIGCGEQATSTCTFNYPERHVWIGPLTFDHEPGAYDLCEHHSSSFTAPIGWEVTDLRGNLHPVEKLPA